MTDENNAADTRGEDEPRTEDDAVSRSRLEAELSRGELGELPPNQPKGILGDRGFDIYAVDTFEPDLNAGVSQELDAPVVWLGIILAYLVFFPVAFWLLWRSPLFTLRQKQVVSVIGGVGVLAVATYAVLT